MYCGYSQEFQRVKKSTRWFMLIAIGTAALAGFSFASAQDNVATNISRVALEEKEACTKNLKAIYEAIEDYRHDHKDLPNWLSDLVPQYISDATLLVCPSSDAAITVPC